ncbi:MAG: efflux RND transporter permease subunit [Thermodesulfovibrionales bacterium]
MKGTGLSGRVARAFIRSRLTPLLVIASLLLGAMAVMRTPREEEPQIEVPMVDVFVAYPGASAREVEERVSGPVERLLWEVKGVEYVYSISRPGMSLVIVRFYVGEDMEDSLVKTYQKLMSNYDTIPPGVSQPLVKPRTIYDVPVLSLTLWGEGYSGYELRRVAAQLRDELKQDPDAAEVDIIGGQRRQVRVVLDPARLDAYGASALGIMDALARANFSASSGDFRSAGREVAVEAGGFLRDAEDVGSVVTGVFNGRAVYLRDVARVVDGPEEPESYVFMGFGPASPEGRAGRHEAVTLALAKKKGANATDFVHRVLAKTEALKGSAIPAGVRVSVTRNYGETAKEKSDELLKHMLIATAAVILLMALALGLRESLVVAVAVPVTLALTLFVTYAYGYTLNRVTLFALIFSIGILVDDAIVVVENIHRHFRMTGDISPATAVGAVDEVGNPTILATFTVISALLPMAFVSGLMGPYMRPIPVGASAAMVFSLLVAFIVSPWMSFKVLGRGRHAGEKEGGRLHALYERALAPFIDSQPRRLLVFGAVGFLLGLALLLLPLKAVTVKMLPFDNKSELQVVLDMPEGAALEETAALAAEMGRFLEGVPEVADYQAYVGTASPFNFNGLVRHYYLRRGGNVGDIQVNFAPKHERRAQSHDLAARLRPALKAIGDRYGARIKIAEIPPGPPVLSTLVAEVYGPEPEGRLQVARQVRDVFEETGGVVDVDWLVEDDKKKVVFEVDRAKAALSGVSVEAAARTLRASLAGEAAGLAHLEGEKEPVEIFLRLPAAERSAAASLAEVKVPSAAGRLVSLSEVVRTREASVDRTIYHKNLMPVTYVTADLAGTEESPVYAILKMKDRIGEIRPPAGRGGLGQLYASQPALATAYSVKWDGEWQITYEVFRDLGIAFAAVLVLIYILVVAWFGSFVTPLVIMSPIPLTLVGILPGHWLMGSFFTATSMIGFIALAGIIVRNSILLVDFVEAEWADCGSLRDAVIRAGAVRFRPIALTAAAVVVGSFVMLFDPIFEGLAIAMMSGAVAATGLTLVAVPALYYQIFKGRPCPARAGGRAKEGENM